MNTKNCYDGEAPPCDTCDRRRVCAAQLLACRHYRAWVNPVDASASDERIPTHEIYRQMHGYPSAYTVRFGSKGAGRRGVNQHTKDIDAEIRSAMASLRAREVA